MSLQCRGMFVGHNGPQQAKYVPILLLAKKIKLFILLCGMVLFPIGSHGEETPRLKVTVTFSILADLVSQVGGGQVAIKTLVGADSDAHVFQPTPTDAALLASSQILVTNGLGFEGWMERLVNASGFKGKVVVASQGVDTHHGEETGHNHDHPGKMVDPHAWHQVANVRIYVTNITEGLVKVAPQHAATFRQNADRYANDLAELEHWIQDEIATIPKERRKVITSHNAFGYFSRAYGVDFLAPVGLSTDADPSARGVASLIKQMKKEQVKTVFVENMGDPRLAQQLAKESGAKLGGSLYADALSRADGPAPTYIAFMRHNVQLLKKAMVDP